MESLDLPLPSLDVELCDLDHDLVREAQRTPSAHAAGGVERILSLSDRLWFKVKTGRWRGAATHLTESDLPTANPLAKLAPWWLGAGGFRRENDPRDFYEDLVAMFGRDGKSSTRWLPKDWDWERLKLENAVAWEREVRHVVCTLIASSLRTGHPYQATFHSYSVTALARAEAGETYLAVGTENIADPKVFGVIVNAVPGIDSTAWLPEPGGVIGLTPGPGEIIWSTILPPDIADLLLGSFPDNG